MSTEEDIPDESRRSTKESSKEERKKKKKLRAEQESLKSSLSSQEGTHRKKKTSKEEGPSRSSSRHRSSREEGSVRESGSSLSTDKKKKKKRPKEQDEQHAAIERKSILDQLESKATPGTLSTIASVSTDESNEAGQVLSSREEESTRVKKKKQSKDESSSSSRSKKHRTSSSKDPRRSAPSVRHSPVDSDLGRKVKAVRKSQDQEEDHVKLGPVGSVSTTQSTQPEEATASQHDESTERQKKKAMSKEEESRKSKTSKRKKSSSRDRRGSTSRIRGSSVESGRERKAKTLPMSQENVKVRPAGADESIFYGDESIQQVAPPSVSAPRQTNVPSETAKIRTSSVKPEKRTSISSDRMFTVRKGTGGKQWNEEEAMESYGSNQDFSAVSHSSGFSTPASSRAVKSSGDSRQRVGAHYEATMPDRIQSMLNRKFNELDETGQAQEPKQEEQVGAHPETNVPNRLQSMMDRKFYDLGQSSQEGFLSSSAESRRVLSSAQARQMSMERNYVTSSSLIPRGTLQPIDVDDPALASSSQRRDLNPAATNFSMWNTGTDKNSVVAPSPDIVANQMMDDQEMALSGVERKEARLSAGLCPDCGRTRTHEKIKYGPFQAFRKMEPVTTPGHVYKGYCLFCNNLHDLRRHLHEPYLREQDLDGTTSSLLTDMEAAKVAAMCRGESDEDLDFARKKRRTQICLCLVVLAIIASGIVIAVTFVGNESNHANSVGTASPPTPAPGPIGWYQMGSDISKPIKSFGYKVSISDSGRRVAVASPKANDNSGRVEVFEFFNTTQQWEAIGVPILGDLEDDMAGFAMDLSGDGNHVIVGYPGNGKGFVRVFRFSDGEWKQLGSTIQGQNDSGWFGAAVFITRAGKSIVIGAPYETNEKGSEAGRVRTFLLQDGEWVKIGNDLLGRAALDHFGTSVGIGDDGTKLAVGAPNNDDRWQDGGQVHIYVLDTDNDGVTYWKESLKTLKILGDEEGHAFGSAMSICGYGDTIVSSSLVATSDEGTVGGGDPRVVYIAYVDDVAEELGYGFPEIPGTLGLGNSVDIDFDGTKVVLATLNLAKHAGKAMVYDIAGKANWFVSSDEYGGEALGPDEWLGDGPSVTLSGSGDHFSIGFESIVVNSTSKDTAPIVRVYYHGHGPAQEGDESEV